MDVDFDLFAFETGADVGKEALVFVARASSLTIRNVMRREDDICGSGIREAANHFYGLFVIAGAIIDAWQDVGVDIDHYFFLSP